ncbi:MAG: hypothetical protein O6761_00395 [Thaumarchaeota archaeon]|nr:hypothetical protein [Nitrososphaerota archaeon]
MVKIVVKKEGATQTCGKCGTDLICRLKDYGGNFAPTLQWQNYDGTPHFKTNDGKTYACNVPDKEETEQTRIPSEIPTEAPAATTPGVLPPSINLSIINTLEEIKLTLQRMDEMVQAIFRYTVDEQLSKKK